MFELFIGRFFALAFHLDYLRLGIGFSLQLMPKISWEVQAASRHQEM